MSEWIRHRGSKSMPKCLEGKRFEVRRRDGVIVEYDGKGSWYWDRRGSDWDIFAFRILGYIEQPKTAIELQAEEVGIPEPVQLVDDDTHLGIKRPDGDGWVKYNSGDVVDLDGVVSIDWADAIGHNMTCTDPKELRWADNETDQIAWYRLNYGDASQHYTSEQLAAKADKRIDDAAQGVREAFGIAMPTNKYQRTIKGVTVDVYDVLAAFGVTCQARGHAIKKLLMAGQRGHKDEAQDLREAVQAIERSIELIGK